jgi:chromosome segregation ATPase
MGSMLVGNGGHDSTNEHRLEAQLRELAARLDGLNAEVKVKFDGVTAMSAERDKRYEQRFATSDTAIAAALAAQQVAVAAALSAQKEATAAAFAASEKAIVKAETAQSNYNERSNEFRAALDDSNKQNISRNEAETRFKAFEDKIEDMKKAREMLDTEVRKSLADLRETRSSNEGEKGKGMSDRTLMFSVIGVMMVLLTIAIGVIEFIISSNR